MTVKQYLRDQVAKTRIQTPVNFQGTDLTNHNNESCGPYVYMDMNHGIFLKQSNNGGHSGDSNNEKSHSVESQQCNAGVGNPTVPRVEDQTRTKNVNMPQSELSSRPKLIWTRSCQVSLRPQRLGVVEEH